MNGFMKGVIGVGLVSMMLSSVLMAEEIDRLVDKLVEKELLTPFEAGIIVDETRKDVASDLAKGELNAVPAWTQKVTLKGDFRMRGQSDICAWQNTTKNRVRIRARLGVEAIVNNNMKAMIGFCSGSADPRSTNQTLETFFTTKTIMLDYAYADLDLMDEVRLNAGKTPVSKVLWQTSDLLWDTDLTVEGVNVAVNNILLGNDVFLNAGILLIGSSTNGNFAPSLTFIQPGAKVNIGDSAYAQFSLDIYDFTGVANLSTANSYTSATNTLLANGRWQYDYDSIGLSFETGMNSPLGLLPFAGLYGQVHRSSETNDTNKGYLVGLKLGDSAVKTPGQWQARYMLRYLEKDAWLDFLPDSDAFEGKTNMRGTEFILDYALANNLSLALDYYTGESLSGGEPKNVLQLDAVWKF